MRKVFFLILSVIFITLSVITILNITYVDRVVVPSFPVYPKSEFSEKSVVPGCINHTTGQPNCVETRYSWNSNTVTGRIITWYKSLKPDQSWNCRESQRVPEPTQIGYVYLNCLFENKTYELLLQPDGFVTGITLIVSSSI